MGVRAGDVGIWHESIMHGGAPIRNMTLTRRSIVVHFARRWMNLDEIMGKAISLSKKKKIPVSTTMATLGEIYRMDDGTDRFHQWLTEMGFHIPWSVAADILLK